MEMQQMRGVLARMSGDPIYMVVLFWAGGAAVWSWSSALGAFANAEMPLVFSLIIGLSAAATTVGAVMTAISIVRGSST
jgi:hypothetical protein